MKRRASLISFALVIILVGAPWFSIVAHANGWHFGMTATSDIRISQGFGFTMAIKGDKSLWAWGSGVLGDGINRNFWVGDHTASPIKIMDQVASVASVRHRTFAITTDGVLYAWGSGALGDGREYTLGSPALTPVRIMDSVVSVTAYDTSEVVNVYSTFAITTDGSLWAWGTGQLGDGIRREMFDGNPALTPVRIMDSVVSVYTGYDRTYAIQSNGSLWAWGATASGLLGCGTVGDWNDFRTTPIKIMDSIASVYIGPSSTMVLDTDGRLWAWGTGPVGDGSLHSWERPLTTPVMIMDDVVSISESKALRADGSLWAWGYSFPGDGTVRSWDRPALSPIRVMDSVAIILETGYRYSMVITTDGRLWAWGSNLGGQLGDGTASGFDYGTGEIFYYEDYGLEDDEFIYIDNDRPTPVMILDAVVYASTFYHYGPGSTIAIRTDGSMWVWGSNDNGQLGDGTSTRHYSPVKISGDTDWIGSAASSDTASDSDPDAMTETPPDHTAQQETPESSDETETGRNPGSTPTTESRTSMPVWLIIICAVLFMIACVSIALIFVIKRKTGR